MIPFDYAQKKAVGSRLATNKFMDNINTALFLYGQLRQRSVARPSIAGFGRGGGGGACDGAGDPAESTYVGDPASNTGVLSTKPSEVSSPQSRFSYGFDGFRFTFHQDSFQNIKDSLERFLCEPFQCRDGRFSGIYESKYISPSGYILARDAISHSPNPDAAPRTDAILVIPGSCAGSLPLPRLAHLLRIIQKLPDCRCTRMDIFIDDYSKKISPHLIDKAFITGNIKGFRLQTRQWIQSGSDFASTIAMGRRGNSGSGKYFRCYEKFKESMGTEHFIDANRMEFEFSGDYSNSLAHVLFDFFDDEDKYLYDNALNFVLSTFKAAVSFLDRSVSSKPDRCPMLQWWAEIFEQIAPLHYRRIIPPKSIERSKKWIQSQVAPSLSMIYESYGEDEDGEFWAFFWDLIFQGAERFSQHHKDILESIRSYHESRAYS